MHCPKCGAPRTADDEFCTNCGRLLRKHSPVVGQPSGGEKIQRAPRRATLPLFAILAVVAVSAGLFAAYYIGRGGRVGSNAQSDLRQASPGSATVAKQVSRPWKEPQSQPGQPKQTTPVGAPSHLSTREREHQRQAMIDLRAIATSCQSYAVDNNHFPAVGRFDGGSLHWVDATRLSKFLVPDYIRQVPVTDPWGHEYRYALGADERSFALLCTGSDGILDQESLPSTFRETRCFENDLIWVTDTFRQLPKGPQHFCKQHHNVLGQAVAGENDS